LSGCGFCLANIRSSGKMLDALGRHPKAHTRKHLSCQRRVWIGRSLLPAAPLPLKRSPGYKRGRRQRNAPILARWSARRLETAGTATGTQNTRLGMTPDGNSPIPGSASLCIPVRACRQPPISRPSRYQTTRINTFGHPRRVLSSEKTESRSEQDLSCPGKRLGLSLYYNRSVSADFRAFAPVEVTSQPTVDFTAFP
jgi:hypothetical protein